MDKQRILEELHAGVTTVIFTKVNGDRREMTCTLNEAFMPPREDDNKKQTRKENPAVQSVWDVNAKGWRSFRWENVLDE